LKENDRPTTYQEAFDKREAEYKEKLKAALEEFGQMPNKSILRDNGTVDNAKECAKKYKVKFQDLLKTRKPGNNIIGGKTWDKNGNISILKK